MIWASKPIRARASTSARSKAKDSRHHLFDPTQEPGEWKGEGPKLFGLGKFIKEKEWQNLLDGFSPDGSQKLVANAGDPYRQAAWPITIAPPKDFAALYGALPPEIKKILWDINELATHVGLGRLEEGCAGEASRRCERSGKGEKAALFWGIFRHYESQALDPFIHTHAILLNLCVRQDGTTGPINSIHFFRELKAANAAYEAELASLLKKELGLTIIPLEKGGFEIKGVPKALCQEWSKRSAAIKAELKKRNKTSLRDKNFAAHNTRPDKEILSREALFARWQKTAREFGFSEAEVRKLVHAEKTKDVQKQDFKKAFKAALEKTPKEKLTRNAIIETGRKMAIEHGAGGEDLRAAFREDLPKRKGFIRIEWRPVFKNAPFISPAKLIKTPRIVIGNKDHRKWGDIRYEKKTNFGHVRIQNRYVFRKAPALNPLSKLKLPALRYGKMRQREKELWDKTHFKADLKFGEFRLQERRLFPRALKWNPAKNLKIVVPRFVEKNPESRPRKHQQEHSH